jgi:ribosome maturation factor RimP
VDTARCAEINRALGRELDAGVLSDAGYALTVSSPGLDRPLKFPRQYPKHVGRAIVVTRRRGDGTERLNGVLVSAGERSVTIRPEGAGTALEVGFDSIVEATIGTPW